MQDISEALTLILDSVAQYQLANFATKEHFGAISSSADFRQVWFSSSLPLKKTGSD